MLKNQYTSGIFILKNPEVVDTGLTRIDLAVCLITDPMSKK